MLNKKKAGMLSVIALIAGYNLAAQNGPVSAGSTATGTGGTATYSIGQTDFLTATGTTGSISQGLQQPYEISIITGVEDNTINLSASVYPNPTADFVNLTITNEPGENLIYSLTDLNGKLIRTEKINSKQVSIMMADLQSAIYFVRVIKNNKELKTFKIVKN
jgi:hypothetical protein